MKKLLFLAACTAIAVVSAAQSPVIKDANAQTRNVGSFHGIQVSNAIDLYLNQGGTEAVAVSAKDEKNISRIITEVKDGILIIRFDNPNHFNWNTGNQKLRAYVSFKSIDHLSASGSSDVYVDGDISAPKLGIHLSGSSDFRGSVKVDDLSLDQSGSSDALISGKAVNVNVDLSGASDVKGYDLVSDNCSIHASGSSDVKITVNKELNAHTSGSSDIYYKGTAMVKELHSSGSSSVSKKTNTDYRNNLQTRPDLVFFIQQDWPGHYFLVCTVFRPTFATHIAK